MNGFERAFVIIITPVMYSYKYLFQAYKWITGKDSVSFAWILCVAFGSYSIASDFFRHTWYLFVWIDSLYALVAVWITRCYAHQAVKQLPSDTLQIFRWSPMCLLLASFNAFFIFVYLGMLYYPGMIEAWLTAMWALSVCMYKPGGKSVFAKAKAKLAEIQIRRPVLSPAGV